MQGEHQFQPNIMKVAALCTMRYKVILLSTIFFKITNNNRSVIRSVTVNVHGVIRNQFPQHNTVRVQVTPDPIIQF